MPWLFGLLIKDEPGGGFDADFVAVTRFIINRTWEERGGDDELYFGFGSKSKEECREKRIACFAEAYGQLRALRYAIWIDPDLAKKKELIIDVCKKGN